MEPAKRSKKLLNYAKKNLFILFFSRDQPLSDPFSRILVQRGGGPVRSSNNALMGGREGTAPRQTPIPVRRIATMQEWKPTVDLGACFSDNAGVCLVENATYERNNDAFIFLKKCQGKLICGLHDFSWRETGDKDRTWANPQRWWPCCFLCVLHVIF